MSRDYGAEIDQLKKELDALKAKLTNDEPETKKVVCSFCGKNNDEAHAIVAGPKENICNECTTLCASILEDTSGSASVGKPGEVYICSFCGKNSNQVGKIIHGKSTATICNHCVHTCQDVLSKAPGKEKPAPNLVTYSGSYSSEGRGSQWSSTVNANDLFTLIENKTATQVLQGIGNNDRLNLLLAILKKPMNVSTMVSTCGFNTTGQVYHHLKPLIAADLVREEGRGEKGVYVVVPHRVQGIIMILAGIADLVDTQHTEGDWSQAAVVYE